MRTALAAAAVVGLLAVSSTDVAAQQDEAAWLAMTFTPYGALPPVVTPRMIGLAPTDARPASAFELRYGRWSFRGDPNEFNTFGFGGRVGPVGGVVGYETCSGCDGIILGGVDFESALATSSMGTGAAPSLFSMGLRPALGFGVFTGNGDGYTLSGTIDVPFSLSVPVGATAHLVPFLSPGFGVGLISAGGESESGVRASLGGGAGIVTTKGLGINLGWRKIFIDDGPSTVGLALSFAR